MKKKTLLSLALVIVLFSCSGHTPSVGLWGPVPFSQFQNAEIGKPINIPFFSMLMIKEEGRTTDFHSDSITVSVLVPQGWIVQDVSLLILNENLDKYFNALEKKMDGFAIYEKLISEKPEMERGRFTDSLFSALMPNLLPPLNKCKRNNHYDNYLTSILDTGRTGRQFQTFSIDLPINLPRTKNSSDISIVGNIKLIPTTLGRHNVGYFMSLDDFSTWEAAQDTSKKLDTVLTCFVDFDSVFVSGNAVSIMAPDANSSFFISSSPNPMSSQNGVVSFLMQGKEAKLALYDINGRPIFKEDISDGGLGIRKYLISQFVKRPLVAGQYILNLEMNGKKLSRPITVIR
ncbi:MAG: T9SS type A sorting domain-containing protein [Fibrobacteres bacterium]|nr:T9SS type A sorting domain-containing protein [Fibrobacterota bacterium]